MMIDASERGRDRSYTFWKSDDGCCQASGADHGRPHVERLNARAVQLRTTKHDKFGRRQRLNFAAPGKCGKLFLTADL